jgi:tRNA (guanine10-N2)-methyltransferase
MHFGRFIGASARDQIRKFDLKKRTYIATTSMEAELALITANIACAAPGKLFYDPFVGTGSFPVSCANFGAICWGSDIDGRSIRGKGGKKTLKGNFEQYGLRNGLGDFFAADLTNNPFVKRRLWDGIVCDIPYGVREGLKVLGLKDPEKTPWLVEKGKTHCRYDARSNNFLELSDQYAEIRNTTHQRSPMALLPSLMTCWHSQLGH